MDDQVQTSGVVPKNCPECGEDIFDKYPMPLENGYLAYWCDECDYWEKRLGKKDD